MEGRLDHYELLGVDTSATQDDLKLAYRKQALIWHPDKNPNNVHEATERFKMIQEAYNTLTDPRERAWYDAHKEQILHGKKSEVDLWPYFSSSAYPEGFTDGPLGFFTVYRDLFESLSRSENVEVDKKNAVSRPSFGTAETEEAQVLAFYSYWSEFVTVKAFTNADLYNPADGPNRRVRRLIEDENKKERQKAKRAYIELVRNLVDYLKKRDPRYLAIQEQIRRTQEKKAADEKRKKDEADRLYKEAKEEHRRLEQERYAAMAAEEEEEEEEEEELDVFGCAVCRKQFQNEKQWLNHEKSKKHRQAVAELELEVKLPEDTQEAVVKPKLSKKQKKRQKERLREETKDEADDDVVEEEEDEEEVKRPQKKQGKKNTQREEEINDDASPKDEDEEEIKRPQKKQKKGKPEQVKENQEEEEPEEESKRPLTKKQRRKAKAEEAAKEPKPPAPAPAPVEEEGKGPKMGKAKLKREKKKLKEAGGQSMKCAGCGEEFDTRNKLFTHINDTGHAKPLN
mmetsp:Transcript_24208/g.43037  ORF Transcript_24208/g.43037 Transcript_24208/m.43037 type:complete len:512 (+) Transcript_24208:6-1541(+)